MAIASFVKDPAAKLDYEIDWSDWLIGDTIATSTWTVPAGITNVTSSNTAVTATIRLSGGTHGQNYEVLNHIVTASGQEDERSIVIEVRQVEAGASLDATDRSEALLTLSEWVQIDVAPKLEETEIEIILDRCKRASTWASATNYDPGDVVLPTTRNGHRYRATVGGRSGATEPSWSTTDYSKLDEGSSDPNLRWIEDGPDYGNVYDLRRAAYECWALKERKATQFISAGELNFGQVYEHCHSQKISFSSAVVA